MIDTRVGPGCLGLERRAYRTQDIDIKLEFAVSGSRRTRTHKRRSATCFQNRLLIQPDDFQFQNCESRIRTNTSTFRASRPTVRRSRMNSAFYDSQGAIIHNQDHLFHWSTFNRPIAKNTSPRNRTSINRFDDIQPSITTASQNQISKSACTTDIRLPFSNRGLGGIRTRA